MANNTAFTVTKASQGPAAPQSAAGRITFPATAITAADYVIVEVGFTPRYVNWVNNTSRIQVEWFDGMADDSCIHTLAAGTRALSVTGGNKGITICDVDGTANAAGKYFKVSQNATLLAIAASDVINWSAEG